MKARTLLTSALTVLLALALSSPAAAQLTKDQLEQLDFTIDGTWTWATGPFGFSSGSCSAESCNSGGTYGQQCFDAGPKLWICNAATGSFIQVGTGGGGGGLTHTVNGSGLTSSTAIDFDDALPAAPAGSVSVLWFKDTSDPTNVAATPDPTGAYTWTGLHTFDAGIDTATITNTGNIALTPSNAFTVDGDTQHVIERSGLSPGSNGILLVRGDWGTGTIGDENVVNFEMSDHLGSQFTAAQFRVIADGVTQGSEDARVVFFITRGGTPVRTVTMGAPAAPMTLTIGRNVDEAIALSFDQDTTNGGLTFVSGATHFELSHGLKVNDGIVSAKLSADSQPRVQLQTDGSVELGDGSSATDVFIERTGTGTLQLRPESANEDVTVDLFGNAGAEDFIVKNSDGGFLIRIPSDGVSTITHANAAAGAGVPLKYQVTRLTVGTDNDSVVTEFATEDSAGQVQVFGTTRIVATTVLTSNKESDFRVDLLTGNVSSVQFLIDGSAGGDLSFGRPTAENRVLTFERGATDGTLTFDGSNFFSSARWNRASLITPIAYEDEGNIFTQPNRFDGVSGAATLTLKGTTAAQGSPELFYEVTDNDTSTVRMRTTATGVYQIRNDAGTLALQLLVNAGSGLKDLTIDDGDLNLSFAGALVDGRDLDNVVDLAGQLGGAVSTPDVRGIRTTTGPTLLTIAAIADGECLRRTGATVDSTPCGGGGGLTHTVNGSALTSSTAIDFDDAAPAAPGGSVNVLWFKDTSDPTNVAATPDPAGAYTWTGTHTWLLTDASHAVKLTSGSGGTPALRFEPPGASNDVEWDVNTSGVLLVQQDDGLSTVFSFDVNGAANNRDFTVLDGNITLGFAGAEVDGIDVGAHAHTGGTGGAAVDIDDLTAQTTWATAATKITADLTFSGVDADFDAGASNAYPRLLEDATPDGGDCDVADEHGRIVFDSDEAVNEKLKVCTTTGWERVGGAGGGGFTNFNIDGDNVSPQLVSDGETAFFVGGVGIDTTAGATRQVSFAIDQSFAPSWVGLHTFTQPSATTAISLIGTTSSGSSPRIRISTDDPAEDATLQVDANGIFELREAAGNTGFTSAVNAGAGLRHFTVPSGDVILTDGDIVLTAGSSLVDGRDLDNVVDLAGQLGGTVSTPDVRGIRTTTGPTLLTIAAIADGECLRRTGATVDSTPCGGGGGLTHTVNGSALTSSTAIDFDDALPAAPGGSVNVLWFKDTSDPTNVAATPDPAGAYTWTGEHQWSKLQDTDAIRLTATDAGNSLRLSFENNSGTEDVRLYTTAAGALEIENDTGTPLFKFLVNGVAGGRSFELVDGNLLVTDGNIVMSTPDSTVDGIKVNVHDHGAGGGDGVPVISVQDSDTTLTFLGRVRVATTGGGMFYFDTAEKEIVSIGGQIGNTGILPDVRGIRTTTGPTLLTVAAIADGECLRRSGSTIDSTTCGGGGPASSIQVSDGALTVRGEVRIPTATEGLVWFTGAEHTAVSLDLAQNITGAKTFAAGTLTVGADSWTNAQHDHSDADSAGDVALGTGSIGTTPPASDNDTSIATSAFVTSSTTAFTNKTFDTEATGNVFARAQYWNFTAPGAFLERWDGAATASTAARDTENIFLEMSLGGGEWAEWQYVTLPDDFDNTHDLAYRITFRKAAAGATTDDICYDVQFCGTADSEAECTLGTATEVNLANGTTADTNVNQATAATVSASSLVANDVLRLRVTFDEANTACAQDVAANFLGLLVEYGISQ